MPRTPAWGEQHCAADVTVEVYQDDVLIPGADGVSFTYSFFEVLEAVEAYPNGRDGGNGNGGDVLAFSAYGLCNDSATNSSLYSCRFRSATEPDHTLDSGPATVLSLTRLECTVPSWSLAYPEPNSSISLVVNTTASDSADGDGGVTETSAFSIPYTFECCTTRNVTVSAVSPKPAPAKGGFVSNVTVADWAFPFDTTITSGSAMAVELRSTVLDITILGRSAQWVTSSLFRFYTPPGVGKDLDVVVSFEALPLLEFVATAAYDFRAPHVVNVTNNTGGTSGGYSVTVTGRDFGGADFGPVVEFIDQTGADSETNCTNNRWVNDTMVICEDVPAGTGSERQVYVKVGGQQGTSRAVFQYDFPRIDSVAGDPTGDELPDLEFPTGGDVTITISGSNFGSDAEEVLVAFWDGIDGTESFDACGTSDRCQTCELFSADDDQVDVEAVVDDEILCVLPPGTGTDVFIVVYVKEELDSEPFPFSYSPPFISAMTPSSSADPSGDAKLVIYGALVCAVFGLKCQDLLNSRAAPLC